MTIVNRRNAGDYRWHAARVKSMDVDGKGEAQLHPVPNDGPEMVNFTFVMGGRVYWQSKESRLIFCVSNVHKPIPGGMEWGQIRVAFSEDRPDPYGVVGWVYETNYAVAQTDRLGYL